MSEKKVSGKVLMFTGIVIIVFLVAIFGFIFWEPVPEIIQGEAEATEVRISGKVPGRIERFLVDEGDQVKKGDTDWDILILLNKDKVELDDHDYISYPFFELG